MARGTKWPKGCAPGPADTYILGDNTLTSGNYPGFQDYIFGQGPGCSGDIRIILEQIRGESQYDLTGGDNLFQPTIYVRSLQTHVIHNSGNATIYGSYQLADFGATTASTLTGLATEFASSWSRTFDDFPSADQGYPQWPNVPLKRNAGFWNANGRYKRRGKEVKFSIKCGQNYTIRYKTVHSYSYKEYSQPGILAATMGTWPRKSHVMIARLHGELAQLCAGDGGTGPFILGPSETGYMVQSRRYMQYKWAPGNNRPTVYGKYYGPQNTIDYTTARSFIGVPGLKAQRAAGGSGTVQALGATDPFTRQEANINFSSDCSTLALPSVISLPPP